MVCEEGEELSEVIAANYAYALRAGLQLIPQIADDKADQLLERFYGLYDDNSAPLTEKLQLSSTNCASIADLLPYLRGSLTFVTGRLKYPDVGIAVVNGFVAEQPGTPGIRVGVLVDPETDAPEITAAEELLPNKEHLRSRLRGSGENVRTITEMIELYPYDLLIIAAHCGDASGQRWTYESIEFQKESSEPLSLMSRWSRPSEHGRPPECDRVHDVRFARRS